MRNFKLFLVFSLTTLNVHAKDYSEIVQVLKYVETNNNPKAIGDNGNAYGILQIWEICIDDVNRTYNTSYRHEDAFDVTCSEEIFTLYINMLFERFRTKYNKEPTEEDIVRSWNGGIYKGYKNPKTVKYYKRYLKWRNILETRKLKHKFESINQINMNKFQFNGQITKVFDVQEGVSKAGNSWKSIEFTVSETMGEYPQSAKFKLFGVEKVDNFEKYNKEGDMVEVSFNLKSREHGGNTYNTLDAWKVFKQNPSNTKPTQSESLGEEDDDLPF